MKQKREIPIGVQELCRRLKIQLDDLTINLNKAVPAEDQSRRAKLMEQLKRQLAELSG